jgi:hypothetical protein
MLCSPYRAVNKLRLCYTNQSVNDIQWNNRCLFWDPHKTNKYSPYRAENKLRLSYTNQSVNAVQWNNRCLFRDPHKTHKYSPYRAVNTSVSVIQTSQLMLYSEIIAVCSEIHTKHVNTLCGQNVEFSGSFAKFRKATISFVMSFCPSVRLSPWNSAPSGRIFMKSFRIILLTSRQIIMSHYIPGNATFRIFTIHYLQNGPIKYGVPRRCSSVTTKVEISASIFSIFPTQ